MTTIGVVRSWSDEKGWGVVDSPDTPGGCWAHFSTVKILGYVALTPGRRVNLDWERGEQDGFAFRSVGVWPVGADPIETPESPASAAYSSTLTITFDDGSGWSSAGGAAGTDPLSW